MSIPTVSKNEKRIKMFRRGLLSAFVVIVIIMSFPVAAKEAYTIGVTMAITGPGSGTYGPIKDAFDIYFKAINAKGG